MLQFQVLRQIITGVQDSSSSSRLPDVTHVTHSMRSNTGGGNNLGTKLQIPRFLQHLHGKQDSLIPRPPYSPQLRKCAQQNSSLGTILYGRWGHSLEVHNSSRETCEVTLGFLARVSTSTWHSVACVVVSRGPLKFTITKPYSSDTSNYQFCP